MALQFADALRNAMLDAIETTAGTAAKVQIFTGSAPANCAAAATGTKLVEFSLASDWANNAGAVVQGRKDFVVPVSATAIGAGTAGYFRLTKTDGTSCIIQGTVDTSGADLNLDNTSIAVGQTVQITSWQITAPGA